MTIQPVNVPDALWILNCKRLEGYGAGTQARDVSFHYSPGRRALICAWGEGAWWNALADCDYHGAVVHAQEMQERYAKLNAAAIETYTLRVVLCGLWRDDCGWSENQQYRSAEITLPMGLSQLAESRRILASVGAAGFRRDGWAGEDSWRNGTLGVYAMLVD